MLSEEYQINSIDDVVAYLRILASEIGGEHHTPKEAETLLYNLSIKLAELDMKTRVAVKDFAEKMEECTGIGEKHLFLYLRNEDIKKREAAKRGE